MRVIAGWEKAKAQAYLEVAAKAARNSPCLKSKRGAVVVLDSIVVGIGYNRPPDRSSCKTCLRKEHPEKTHTEPCRAVHAEMAALLAARKYDLEDAVMYHIKVKDGEIAASGEPSCTMCAKLILEAKLKGFVLLHEDRMIEYTAQENYEISLASLEKA